MKNKGSVIRTAVIIVFSAGLIFFNIGSLLSFGTSSADFPPAADVSAVGITEEETKTILRTETEKKAEQPTEKTVETAAKGTVKGKIIENFYPSKSANVSYEKVFVKNSSGLKIDLKYFLGAKLPYTVKKNAEPQVLIMHTHTTETFMENDAEYYTDAFTSRSRDKSKNMVFVGNIVAEKLNAAGVKTLHDTTEHDYPKYTGSYSRAADTICGYLKKYPDIKIVLDLHRDAISSGNDKIKPVTKINGKKAAQVMIVMGSQSGDVSNFPDWQENFKLAVKLQQKLEEKYPTLARPLSLMSRNYNESLTKGSLLIEFGSDANSLSEVRYSAELVGNCLAELLG